MENTYTWVFFIFRNKDVTITEYSWGGFILENNGEKIYLELCVYSILGVLQIDSYIFEKQQKTQVTLFGEVTFI